MKIDIFWFRRDLRLTDNRGLFDALKRSNPVLPIFIFDKNILEELPEYDARVSFIHDQLDSIDKALKEKGSGLLIKHGNPLEVWKGLVAEYEIEEAYFSRDYEPYARDRDKEIYEFLKSQNIVMKGHKDQVVFERDEVVKPDGKPYTVYTPYKRKWLEHFSQSDIENHPSEELSNYWQGSFDFPSLEELGFKRSQIQVKDFHLNDLENYGNTRDFPDQDTTSYLSPHLRFGTVSPRQIIRQLGQGTEVFLSELIWREFFMQILFHFPHVLGQSFRPQYDKIEWRNDEQEFEKWKDGQTGFPMVDAGMRQLNETGYMHNRVRMVVASFLCKDLLIDWRWGEAYFAEKLLDYDLSANNGNWQWAAGTGCDAAPYFRIFNPNEQLKKFDPNFQYVKRWVSEYGTSEYPEPMVDRKMTRERALSAYQKAVKA